MSKKYTIWSSGECKKTSWATCIALHVWYNDNESRTGTSTL